MDQALKVFSSEIKEALEKLDKSLRYLVLYGTITPLLLWVEQILKIGLLDSPSRKLIFIVSIILIFLPLPPLIINSISQLLKKWYFLCVYPSEKMNVNFYIISFKGRVCILDEDRKEIRWIKSWQTAIDLGIVGEWTNVEEIDITLPNSLLESKFKTKDGKEIHLKKYRYVDGILTQGTPGT